jgi:hypothetical protein
MRFNTLTMRQYTLLKNMLQLWYDIIVKTTTSTLPQLQCKCGPQFKSIITTGMPIWDIDEFLKHLGVTKKRSNITRKLTMILIWRCMLLIKIYLFWMLFTIMTSSWTKISKHIFQFFFCLEYKFRNMFSKIFVQGQNRNIRRREKIDIETYGLTYVGMLVCSCSISHCFHTILILIIHFRSDGCHVKQRQNRRKYNFKKSVSHMLAVALPVATSPSLLFYHENHVLNNSHRAIAHFYEIIG